MLVEPTGEKILLGQEGRMSTRALRHPISSRFGATHDTAPRADAPAMPTPQMSKVAAVRLNRLKASDMPWLGQGRDAMLAGYDGREVSGPGWTV